jgi:hypothetical protein
MYTTKTEHIENIVKPIIENYASSLIIESSETDTTISMALARTQALLLYMSMRELHYVERDLPVLEKWTEHLTYIRDSSSVERTTVSTTTAENWDAWLFWECVSRTILASACFINVYCLLARGELLLGEWSKPYMWTASKALWSAENSGEFYDR